MSSWSRFARLLSGLGPIAAIALSTLHRTATLQVATEIKTLVIVYLAITS